MSESERCTFTARDGYSLSGTFHPAESRARATVVVAAATGVPHRFYQRFAAALARDGLDVVTFDYRGIGASAPASLRGFEASFLTWAEQDLAAVVDWSLARGPTAVIGHSFGGHAFGLLDRANETLGLYTFGTGAGWYGHMPLGEQPRVLFMWNVVGPLSTAVCGYLPSKRLGLGEDLPLGVYRQWKRWCSFPNHFFGDPHHDFGARFARVSTPVVAVNARDDAWATARSAQAFMRGYSEAPVELRVAEPGPDGIGHMGYFREPNASLWAGVTAWVGARLGSEARRSA